MSHRHKPNPVPVGPWHAELTAAYSWVNPTGVIRVLRSLRSRLSDHQISARSA